MVKLSDVFWCEFNTKDWAEEFENNADIAEGVSGRVEINTKFENYEPLRNIHSRGGTGDE